MAKLETITLGGGCFWCLEASFQLINGVTKVTSGYAGGTTQDPTFEQVATRRTGHAEVVQIEFDTEIITLEDVLDIFWAIHNPTTLNRQNYDVGPEYRSIILYEGERQKEVAQRSIAEVGKLWPDPIVTELSPLTKFYMAEEVHQNYFRKNPTQGYCQVVINPKLEKLRQKFTERLVV